MRKVYEIDKITILEKIDSIKKTISERLLPTFDTIEQEAKQLSEQKLLELSSRFNPEFTDESDVYDQAFHRGVDHYIVQSDMKIEFLKSAATWIFHLFEKDCTYIFGTEDGKLKLEHLSKLNIDTSEESNWYKCNTELRALSNSIKHGKGSSFEKLKTLRPDLIIETDNFLSKSDIVIEMENINEYIEFMNSFWNIFFNKVLDL